MPAEPAVAADFPALFAHFRAEPMAERSIYPYSPVFRCRIGGQQAVLKHTRSRPESAAAVVAVTTHWASQGVPVVSPLDLPVANPVRLAGTIWVAYPFIAGRPYTGGLSEVAAAGALLGRMHASTAAARLPAYEWPAYDEESITRDVTGLRTVMAAHATEQAVARMVRLVSSFMSDLLPPLRTARLPYVNASLDFKANNLVYTSGGPVLVDPDNGDYAPRLLDLAQALLLFHAEHDLAPPRLFNQPEWSAFTRAYLGYVRLTDDERALWPTAIDYLLSEEGVWALTNDPDDWRPPRERSFLLALAGIRANDYPLP